MSLLLLIIIGAVLWSVLGAGTHRARYRSSRSGGLGLGRLPGDVTYRGTRTRVYAPIMSSLLISLALSVLLTLLLNAAVH